MGATANGGRGGAGWSRRGAIVVGGLAAACASASAGRTGDLGHGVFSYQCLTDQDAICPQGSQSMPGCDTTLTTATNQQCFPSSIAVGGRFRTQYAPTVSSSQAGNPVLKSAAPDLMSSLGDGQFKALKAGYVGVYSQSTVDSTLLDYTLVKIEAISKLQIDDTTTKVAAPATVALGVGGSAAYQLVALGASGGKLAGAIESFTWESSDPTVLALADATNSATMQVRAVAAGTATLTAYADDTKAVKTSLQITVK